jgi:YCII-related domain
MMKLIEEETKAGVALESEGLQPTSKTARVRLSREKVTTQDGPFAETEEVIAGYSVIRASSKQEAIESAKRFLEVAILIALTSAMTSWAGVIVALAGAVAFGWVTATSARLRSEVSRA